MGPPRAPRGVDASTDRSSVESASAAVVGEMHVFPELPYESFPHMIAAGPDHNMWFTELEGNRIGRITTSGAVTEFSVPTAESGPAGIAAGPDGNMWFTKEKGNKIGRITTTGEITEFPIPTADSGPKRITTGPDANLWFTEEWGNKIGRITPTGEITEFPIPTAESAPTGITVGPDGNVWFTEFSAIGRITVLGELPTGGERVETHARVIRTGAIVEFPIESFDTEPRGITTGPDGNLWFTKSGPNSGIGRITPSGEIAQFSEGIVHSATGSSPSEITVGADRNLWFTDGLTGRIGRLTTDGAITEFSTETEYSEPTGIAAQGDVIWFTEREANRIGWIRARARIVSSPLGPTGLPRAAGSA